MTNVVHLGCEVAEIHHQYAAVHGALFGATSFRLVLSAMTGRTPAKAYRKNLNTLEELRARLSVLAAAIPTADAGAAAHLVGEMRRTLSEYVATLDAAIADLETICTRLLGDMDAYSASTEGGQSAFHRDKIRYDRVLLELEKLGRRLNRLFSRF